MGVIGQVGLIGAVAAAVVGAAVSAAGMGTVDRRCRTTAQLSWLSAVLVLLTVVSVAWRGPVLAVVDGVPRRPAVGLWANQLTVTLMLLISVVGAMVQSFSLRYLQGDPSAPRFFAASSVVVAAMSVVCTAATVPVLVCAWIVAGGAFVVVLGCRPDLPGVRSATRRVAWMLGGGDLALLGALLLVCTRAGNVDLASPGALRAAGVRLGSLVTLVALLVVVAALSRSAQGPFGRWLPGTVSAPTPASALLHAGVVNGGGILLVRLGVLTGGSVAAMVVVLVLAAGTAVVADAVMRHKADVKGSLVFSTMSQMGFMVAECAVGAYLAAVVHLLGHALYKATLFFGSGSQVARTGQAPAPPGTRPSALLRSVTTVVAVAATIAVMAAIPDVRAHRGGMVLLVFAAATAASTSWAWSGRARVAVGSMAASVVTVLIAGTLYGLVLGGLGRWIAPAIPATGSGTLSPWWLLAVAVAGIATATVGRLPKLQRRVVARLVDAGTQPAQPVTIAQPVNGPGGLESGPQVGTATLWKEGVR